MEVRKGGGRSSSHKVSLNLNVYNLHWEIELDNVGLNAKGFDGTSISPKGPCPLASKQCVKQCDTVPASADIYIPRQAT